MTSVAETPAVSVIMPVYNGAKYLREAVDSILRQSFRDFEFIIVDDGSTDSTWAILQSYDGPSVVLLHNEENIGLPRSLNKGLAVARGNYIARIDADDTAEPNRLERQLAFLQHHPEVGLLGTASRVLYEDLGYERLRRPPLTNLELRSALVRRNPFLHSSVMIPHRVLEVVGGYNERLVKAEDYDLWVRIGSNYRLANLPDVLAMKRVHELSFSRKFALRETYKIHVAIRWHAWRRFSLPLTDLRFILYPNRLPLKSVANKFPKFAALYRRVRVRMRKGKLGA